MTMAVRVREPPAEIGEFPDGDLNPAETIVVYGVGSGAIRP